MRYTTMRDSTANSASGRWGFVLLILKSGLSHAKPESGNYAEAFAQLERQIVRDLTCRSRPNGIVRTEYAATRCTTTHSHPGVSLADIGTRLGFNGATIHNHLRKAGVAMRDTHGRDR
jgi:hypothetical protein